MSVPIKPLADRVVAIREKAAEKTNSGIYLPEAVKQDPIIAIVEAVGPEVKNIKKGDRIVYDKYGKSVTELTTGNQEYLIVKEKDVIGTIN